MNRPGLGVMLRAMAGYRESAEALVATCGKEIAKVELVDSCLTLRFVDGCELHLQDRGQSCCESRYMTSDGCDLSYYVGATLLDVEVRDAPPQASEYGDHDVQFLAVKTSKGEFVVSSHNEHNGYYGGFSIEARAVHP